MVTLSVTLTPAALRRALDLLESDGIVSLDDLVERLIVSAGSGEIGGAVDSTGQDARPQSQLLAPIPGGPTLELAPTPEGPAGRLPFLTNRLNPIKVFCRTLANSAAAQGAWPQPHVLAQHAGVAARELGVRLRSEDGATGRKGLDRRWVAYPVGGRAESAVLRFGFAFGAAHTPSGELGGPLVVLGLATSNGQAVALTEAGWRLAALPSALLGEADAGGARLTDSEAELLTARLLDAPQERGLIEDFIASIREADGQQPLVDRALAARRPDWSPERAASERSALVGRLHELGVVRVVGRGRQAHIELLDIEALGSNDHR